MSRGNITESNHGKVRVVPTVEATDAELRVIEAGRREIARGEYVTLEEIEHEMEADSR